MLEKLIGYIEYLKIKKSIKYIERIRKNHIKEANRLGREIATLNHKRRRVKTLIRDYDSILKKLKEELL